LREVRSPRARGATCLPLGFSEADKTFVGSFIIGTVLRIQLQKRDLRGSKKGSTGYEEAREQTVCTGTASEKERKGKSSYKVLEALADVDRLDWECVKALKRAEQLLSWGEMVSQSARTRTTLHME